MRERRPPALAAWLLDKLGHLEHNPALAGDLLEEFHNGRSRAWYCRQTALAIGAGAWQNARTGLLEDFALVALFQALLDYTLWRYGPELGYPRLAGLLLVWGFLYVAKRTRGPIGGGKDHTILVVSALVMSCMSPHPVDGYSLLHRMLDHEIILAVWFLWLALRASRVDTAGESGASKPFIEG